MLIVADLVSLSVILFSYENIQNMESNNAQTAKLEVIYGSIDISAKSEKMTCLFDSLRPINNLSIKQGRVLLG